MTYIAINPYINTLSYSDNKPTINIINAFKPGVYMVCDLLLERN